MIYVALLRGINVGGNRRIEMPKLKAAFEDYGFSNVTTYINSGNVIFQTTPIPEYDLVKKIEQLIKDNFGFSVDTLVRSVLSIKTIIQAIDKTWTNDADQKTDVLFLWDELDASIAKSSIKHQPDVDTIITTNEALIWNIKRKNYSKSGMNDLIKNPLYKKMTVRNCNTVRKLYDLMQV